jgi:hypothetical protein
LTELLLINQLKTFISTLHDADLFRLRPTKAKVGIFCIVGIVMEDISLRLFCLHQLPVFKAWYNSSEIFDMRISLTCHETESTLFIFVPVVYSFVLKKYCDQIFSHSWRQLNLMHSTVIGLEEFSRLPLEEETNFWNIQFHVCFGIDSTYEM